MCGKSLFFKFLGVHVAIDLTWSTNTSTVVIKAQQRLHFLRLLRKCQLETKLVQTFYHTTTESVLAYCITVWFAGHKIKNKKALQGVIKTAQKINGCPLPSLEDVANSRGLNRARRILADPSHPGRSFLNLLRERQRRGRKDFF